MTEDLDPCPLCASAMAITDPKWFGHEVNACLLSGWEFAIEDVPTWNREGQ
jgi:hypothetical protein